MFLARIETCFVLLDTVKKFWERNLHEKMISPARLELRLPDWDRCAYQVGNRRSFQNYCNFAQTRAIFHSVTPVIRDEISRRTLSSLFFQRSGWLRQKNTKNNKRGAIVTDDVCSCEISLCSSPATWCVVLFCRTARRFFCCAQSTHSQRV